MKTVIEMAREAGAIHIHERPKEFAIVGNETIERFAELVRADEREACAQLAEKLTWADNKGVASAIRARSNT